MGRAHVFCVVPLSGERGMNHSAVIVGEIRRRRERKAKAAHEMRIVKMTN